MNKAFFLFFTCLLLPRFLPAQVPVPGQPPEPVIITGAITGELVDSITRQTIEYASVGVFNATTQQVVDGTISDERGNFRIAELPPGRYNLQISFVGYRNKTVTGITLTDVKPDFNVGIIMLGPELQLLEAVEIVGEAALIEARPDKIVYNAEQDVTSRGGDAADVLRKVPLLTVDLDGNVSMRGSDNVRVLINGRPSSIFNNNLADALKMMPSDQIKSVEVITAPSAKYDGEGTAGIINIITKKKNVQGLAGSVDLTGGTRHNRGNVNVSYGKGRLGMNFSGGGHYSPTQEGTFESIREDQIFNTENVLTQDGANSSSRLGYRSNLGLQYNINKLNTISTSFQVRGHDSESENDVNARYTADGTLFEDYNRQVFNNSNRGGWDYELEYELKFDKEQQEFSVAVEIDRDFNHSEGEYFQQYSLPFNVADIEELNLNDGNNIETTADMDYTHPITESVLLEIGGRATLRDIESDFAFQEYDPDLGVWIENAERTDIFYYNQQVYAGYVSSTIKLGEQTTLIAGARYERTQIEGEYDQFEGAFENAYQNVLPNVTLSRKMGEFNQIKVSYNQRIQRPNQRHINPFIEYSDNRDVSFGNPGLTPELVHQVELGTNLFLKDNMISVSLFGRHTDDLIENLVSVNPNGISESTFENFGTRNAIGVNVFGSVNLGKLSLRGGFDVNAWEVEGEFDNETLTNSGYDYNGRINATLEISKTLKAEGFAFFRSPTFTVQGKTPNWSTMSFGVRKEFFNRRLSLGINITEPFRENQPWEREVTGTDFYQYSKSLRPVRSFGVSLGYRFGKLDFKDRQNNRQRPNNNDLKDEDQGGENGFNG
jgi:ferric enterobactin receptor